ncbi:hypothetical protein [Pseudonocardia sp.]|uniref:hypothetical protein n=1 Tax=Pseudonocardia sp. TaxID=60912 RepID=UPI002608FF6B|nr:hypothetical protein [Pseudonocardia sp.]MCW2722826.1 hypothetical protein [Pseudonocardia sp.]MDT7614809.1 hypothetical protein [Pseudonocardiales bacterium]
MTETLQVIDSAGAGPVPAHAELAAVIDAVRECEQASNACAMAMVEAGGMVAEVRRALDCADMCDVTERILSRGPATDLNIVGSVVHACVMACQASAAACGPHAAQYEHCRLHSESAKRCAEALQHLEVSLSF